jgi:hypothetical protein
MTEDPFAELAGLTFIETRIPALDALTTFMPDGREPNDSLKAAVERLSWARFRPVPGGHKVLLPNDGGGFDESTFTVEKGAWDHEHCRVCRAHIPAMTLCWVTEDGPYIILCVECKTELDAR